MCNLYSITTNQAAIIALFRVINRYVGNLPPMPGVFPDYPAPVVRNAGDRELVMMRWGIPPACTALHSSCVVGGDPVQILKSLMYEFSARDESSARGFSILVSASPTVGASISKRVL